MAAATVNGLLLMTALLAGTVHAQTTPSAYQLAAQRAGIPSAVLYAVALQESGIHPSEPASGAVAVVAQCGGAVTAF